METQLGTLITLYVILLGPFKLIPVFHRTSVNADNALRRQIATRAVLVSTVICVVVLGIGGFLMTRFNLSVGSLSIVMGIFLFHWAFATALALPQTDVASTEIPTRSLAIFPVSFPGIIPPQGLALLILSADLAVEAGIGSDLFTAMGVVLIVMGLNWVFMVATPFLMKGPGPILLGILSRVFAVVIAALSVQVILAGLRDLGIVA